MKVERVGAMSVDTTVRSILTFFENINIGSRKLIPFFDDPRRKSRSFLPAMALTLEGLVKLSKREDENARSDPRQIFNSTVRSSRNYRHCNLSSLGKLCRPITRLVANPWNVKCVFLCNRAMLTWYKKSRLLFGPGCFRESFPKNWSLLPSIVKENKRDTFWFSKRQHAHSFLFYQV